MQQIIDLIEEKLGLKRNSISLLIWQDRIQTRMAACHLQSYEEYIQLLNTSSRERQEFIELIVNLETWFFRERGAFDYLTYFVKQTREKKSSIKILSLACSTGEEPYSMVMALLDAGISLDHIEINALDISGKALEKAKEGIYRKIAFREDDLKFRDCYFQNIKSGYAINNFVKEHVSFYKGNILEDESIFDFHSYDIIFCRNVLIYLTQESQTKVFNFLKTLLAPHGILVLGLAEGKIALNAGLELILIPGVSVFTINSERANEGQKKAFPSAPLLKHSSLHASKQKGISIKPSSDLLQLASSLEETTDKALLLQQALNAANTGTLKEAEELCALYIRQYGAHPEIYYLLGLLNHTQEKEEEAKQYFHKAVYLDPSHSEALICLALLYESEGKRDQAELFRKRALKNL